MRQGKCHEQLPGGVGLTLSRWEESARFQALPRPPLQHWQRVGDTSGPRAASQHALTPGCCLRGRSGTPRSQASSSRSGISSCFCTCCTSPRCLPTTSWLSGLSLDHIVVGIVCVLTSWPTGVVVQHRNEIRVTNRPRHPLAHIWAAVVRFRFRLRGGAGITGDRVRRTACGNHFSMEEPSYHIEESFKNLHSRLKNFHLYI